MSMTLDQAIVELRGLDPYSAYPVTDAQEEAAHTVIAAIGRVRTRHRQVIDSSWPAPGHCEECLTGDESGELDYVPYPCPTVRDLDGTS